MIPIRDTTPSKNYPVINMTIIGINVVIYLIELTQGGDLMQFFYLYGLVPARYTITEFYEYFTPFQQIVSLFSFMFVHGGFWHLLGNMWSLYIFGDNVEDHLGHFRYVLFYILCGLASGLFHMAFNFYSKVPIVGASGAIAGVMGAYILLYPHSRILTLIPIFFIPYFIEVPAYLFLGVWFFIQMVNAAGSHGAMTGVAWWAHVGGFLFGMLLLKSLDLLPKLGITEKTRQVTHKKAAPRFQVLKSRQVEGDPNLYGTVSLTPFEAGRGAYKFITVPWIYNGSKLLKLNVPAGIEDGKYLRLKGFGRSNGDGSRGDLFLKIQIE